MTLEEAIVAYSRMNLDDRNDWYLWRRINPKSLPFGITLSSGNEFAKNVSLKKQLSVTYSTGDAAVRQSLTEYYIAVWGGVRRNNATTLLSYSRDEPSVLIAKGVQGVASWSKALSLRAPEQYSIYDARVALSLNALQITKQVETPLLFPLLKGQNKTVNRGSKEVARFATQNHWPAASATAFYQQYNNLLFLVSEILGVEQYEVEMLLFAKAKDLLISAFPREQF